MCVDISLFSYQVKRSSSLLMGEQSVCGCTWCWYGRSESYFRKDHTSCQEKKLVIHYCVKMVIKCV
jgi:hypothetical protein